MPLVSQSQLDTSDLLHRLVLLTAAFEVGSTAPDEIFSYVTGNFDGQGITLGPVGFSWRADEIQRLLRVMEKDHPGVLLRIFGGQYVELRAILVKDMATQMAWAERLSAHNGASIAEPWLTQFRSLGRTSEFKEVTYAEIQTRYLNRAIQQCDQLGLLSQRGLALVFDTEVQNGERGLSHALQELTANAQLIQQRDEVARMIVIARAIADTSNTRYRADVLNRKMIIATGNGVLHRTKYDLSAVRDNARAVEALNEAADKFGHDDASPRPTSRPQPVEHRFATDWRSGNRDEVDPNRLAGSARESCKILTSTQCDAGRLYSSCHDLGPSHDSRAAWLISDGWPIWGQMFSVLQVSFFVELFASD